MDEYTPIDMMIDGFVDMFDGSDFSFGHIVLSDHNTGISAIDVCLEPERIKEWIDQKVKDGGDRAEITALAETIKTFLEFLKLIQVKHGVM